MTTTSHKYSFSVPSTPAYSPVVSPTTTRSLKSHRFPVSPVTPQRLPRKHHPRSPATPLSSLSTPYTPLSLRSFPSSAFTTPGSASSIKRLSFSSVSPENRDKSLADIAENWRSRANENGIKVSSSCEEGHFADDEASDDFITTEEALLSPPFLSSTQRRARALSQSQIPPRSSSSISPHVTRTSSRRVLATLNTPPPKPSYAHQLKLRGSLTDPPHTRRRPSFSHPQTDLFDISENDHEYTPYPQSLASAGDAPARLIGVPLSLNDPFTDPLLPTITQSIPHNLQHLESSNNQYHYNQDEEDQHAYYQLQYQHPVIPVPFTAQNYTRIFPSLPPFTQTFQTPALSFSHAVPVLPTSFPPQPKLHSSPTPSPSACSVCDRPPATTLAILAPCGHPLCSACLTSALNIVGEKDMECAVCKRGVADFKLSTAGKLSGSAGLMINRAEKEKLERKDFTGKSFMDPLFSSPGSAAESGAVKCVAEDTGTNVDGERLLPSAFDGEFDGSIGSEHGFQFFDFENAREASTPIPTELDNRAKGGRERVADNVVLRIDNVPWDITPPAIVTWLKQPVARVHVLLDHKGKTLSHAFVEVAGEEAARAALRGAQNSVLGKGRRARGVTVTRSGQEELMRALFPSWRGEFDGARPSLAGLDHERVVSTLGSGLMTEGELEALLHLIRSPDSHFLKVPSLPFHSLISILSKFPADVDSRVFWSGVLRDVLFDVTMAAIEVLRSQDPSGVDLLAQVVHAGMDCQAFTSQQVTRLSKYVDPSAASSVSTLPTDVPTPDSGSHNHNFKQDLPSVDRGDVSVEYREAQSPFGALAREFGVETQLVQALVQRLAGMC